VQVESRTYRLRMLLLGGAAVLVSNQAAYAQDEQNAIVLDAVTVEAQSNEILKQEGYVAKQDRIGTKVDTPIAQIPQAISVVTQKQIEDQEPRTLNEALTYTASANPNSFGFDSRFDAFSLRGFPAYYNGMFRDGLRQFNSPTALFKTEPYGLEGITILKGPASSLYGVSGPGGIVNLVTKRPKEETFREVETVFGGHERAQLGFDFSGPVNEDKSLLYRITGLGRSADTDLEGYPDDKLYIAPALTFKPDEDTKLTILSELSRTKTGGTAAFYNPAYGEVSDIYEGDPRYNDFDQTQGRIGYEFEHRFNDLLTVRQNLRYAKVDADLEYSGHYPVGAELARYWGHYKENVATFTVDNMAQFTFDTGPVSHVALAGIDYTYSDYDAASAFSYASVDDIKNAPLAFAGSQKMSNVGIYAHDQMKWDALTLFGSVRYDWVDSKSVDATEEQTDQKDEHFSGRVGLSYETPWGLIPYVNYSTSFAPNIGFVYEAGTEIRSVAQPTVSEQKEIGVKYQIPDTNLLISAALFDIKQKDGVVFDVYGPTGENRQRQLDLNSRGIELEANASFENGFGLIASYTHLKMKIDQGAVGTEGNELSATPNDIFSLWGNYEFNDGALAGLGLGAGVRYVGKSYGDDENTFTNKDRVFVDAAVSYDFGKRFDNFEGVKLQINAKNLFDEQKPICSAGYCYRDEGRSIIGSLRYRF
jgi:iron complex outermembrane receptor protein